MIFEVSEAAPGERHKEKINTLSLAPYALRRRYSKVRIEPVSQALGSKRPISHK